MVLTRVMVVGTRVAVEFVKAPVKIVLDAARAASKRDLKLV